MKGVTVENKLFDKTFDAVASISGPAARVPARPTQPPPADVGGGVLTHVPKPSRPPPVVPQPETVARESLRRGPPAVVMRSPDDVAYAKVHKEAYLKLKAQDVLVSKLRITVSTADGNHRLNRTFLDLGGMAISTNTFATVGWNLDESLVPCHMAGCLGMISFISADKTLAVAPLYKRYAALVKEVLSLCDGPVDKETHGKEFAEMVSKHAGTTADYLGFFVCTDDLLRLSVADVDGMNRNWASGLLDKMSKRVALVRARSAAQRAARVAVQNMTGSCRDDGDDAGAAGVREHEEPTWD